MGGAALVGLFAGGAGAQGEGKGTNWPLYGNDAGAQRYSPLAQITPANVKSLKVAWTYHMKTAGAARVATTQTTLLPAARISYSMARDQVFPKVFASIHPKFLTPAVGTLVKLGSAT